MLIDGFNDKDFDKMNLIMVKFFDINMLRVVICFLDMGVIQGVDVVVVFIIFEVIDEVMIDNSIFWKNCIVFFVDNISVNFGQFNFIKIWVFECNFKCYFFGCLCYIFYNIVGKVFVKLKEVFGFDVDDLVVDIFYYFDKLIK